MLTYILRQTFLMYPMRIGRTLRMFCHEAFCPIFCPLHAVPMAIHCQNKCLAHYHLQVNICSKFHKNCSKKEGEVNNARFVPIFTCNMLLLCQSTFWFCQKKWVLHISTPRHASVKSLGNGSKT